MQALVAAIELRDEAIGYHNERVSAIALELSATVAPRLAADPSLLYGFLLHDIGKLGIPDCILHKPAALDPDELMTMRTHPGLGERIVSPLRFLHGVARDVIACHHEWWDGHGYPRGLCGEAIPLAARIFSIADAYDAMTSDRPYRAALGHREALGRIAYAAGTQFDPELAAAFTAQA